MWIGDIAVGELITFTTSDPQSTIGGEEGNHYTLTAVVTDVSPSSQAITSAMDCHLAT
jgi:hypothetical protein